MDKTQNKKIADNSNNENENEKNIDILKSLIDDEIIKKIDDGTKKEITARDCLKSFLSLDNIKAKFTSDDRKTLVNILTFAIDFDDDDNNDNFNIKLNANIKNQINDLINKVVNIDKMISHNDFKKILKNALIALFGFKFEAKDKTANFASWIVKRKAITINQFVFAFLQSYCYICEMQIVNINNKVFLLKQDDFNEIKANAYKTYNDEIIDKLNK